MLSGMGFEGFADKKALPGAPQYGNKMKTGAANHSLGGMNAMKEGTEDKENPHVKAVPKPASLGKSAEGFADYASVDSNMGPIPMAASNKPQGCYPREQLNPKELLPQDLNSQWAQVNPQGAGDIQGKNFLSAGALIGVNTIGQSLRNANLQLRAEPPCPQVQIGPWNQSTIEPDLMRRPIE
jgi:hypothetical protein